LYCTEEQPTEEGSKAASKESIRRRL